MIGQDEAVTLYSQAFSRSVLVVFKHSTSFWWMRFLKRGFRHCLIALRAEGQWIVVDPLSYRLSVDVVDDETGRQLPDTLREANYTVIETRLPLPPPIRQRRPMPIMSFTCVEVVKRILGVRDRLVFTPWQLYRALIRG